MPKTLVPALLASAFGLMVGTAQATVDTTSLSVTTGESTQEPSLYNPNGDPLMSVRVRVDDISYYGSKFTYRRPDSLATLWRFIREVKFLNSTANLNGRWYIVQPGDVLNSDPRPAGTQLIPAYQLPSVRTPGMPVGREFWLGLILDADNSLTPPKHYGWLRIRFNLFGQPVLVSQALAKGEAGLVVGQTTSCGACSSPAR